MVSSFSRKLEVVPKSNQKLYPYSYTIVIPIKTTQVPSSYATIDLTGIILVAAFTEDDTGAPKPWQWGVQWIGWENLHRKPSIFHEDHGEFVMRNSKMVWITQLNSMSPYYRGKCGCNTRISHMECDVLLSIHPYSYDFWCLQAVYIYTTRKQHVHREDDEGPFNSIFRQNQVEVFWAKRISWQIGSLSPELRNFHYSKKNATGISTTISTTDRKSGSWSPVRP